MTDEHDELLAIVREFLDRGWKLLELDSCGYHIELTRSDGDHTKGAAGPPMSANEPQVVSSEAVAPAKAVDEPPERPSSLEDPAPNSLILSPMMGAFYRAPSPGAPPFVEEGSPVSLGQTVCIIEVMKLMTHIRSEIEGRVAEVLVSDGDLVTEGQPLFKIGQAEA